jgi:hypothetical protein
MYYPVFPEGRAFAIMIECGLLVKTSKDVRCTLFLSPFAPDFATNVGILSVFLSVSVSVSVSVFVSALLRPEVNISEEVRPDASQSLVVTSHFSRRVHPIPS